MKIIQVTGLCTCLVMLAGQTWATTFNLSDLNSTMTFQSVVDESGVERSGVVSWIVNGKPVIVEQSMWYRIGDNGPEKPIASLPRTGAQTSNTNFNPGDDVMALQYTMADSFRLTASYSLQGTMCCGSDLGEQFSILNLGSAPLSFHLFQYTEFAPGSPEVAERLNPNTFSHDGSRWLTEAVLTPGPQNWQIGEAAVVRALLTDALPTTLSNSISPLSGGHLAWAGQWSFVLNPDQTFQLSVDKRVSPVPLPAPAFLLLGGLGAFGYLRRRQTHI